MCTCAVFYIVENPTTQHGMKLIVNYCSCRLCFYKSSSQSIYLKALLFGLNFKFYFFRMVLLNTEFRSLSIISFNQMLIYLALGYKCASDFVIINLMKIYLLFDANSLRRSFVLNI